MPTELPKSELSEYPKGTALIRYRDNDGLHDWFIAADPSDGQASLLAHLSRWRPKAELIGWCVK